MCMTQLLQLSRFLFAVSQVMVCCVVFLFIFYLFSLKISVLAVSKVWVL
jgi:hypothetical protein